MNTIIQSAKEPCDIEALLPWYATGKINAADKARVDKALLTDPELARRLAIVREEIGVVTAHNESLDGPSSRAFDRVMARVAAEPRQAPVLARLRQGLLERMGNLLQAFAPRTLALAACAAVAVVALQTAMLGGLIGGADTSARYGTASAPGHVSTPGAFVMVAFAPAATAADITAFLKRYDASIVDGPRASGLFRIRVGTQPLGVTQLDAIVAGMQKEAGIVSMVAQGN